MQVDELDVTLDTRRLDGMILLLDGMILLLDGMNLRLDGMIFLDVRCSMDPPPRVWRRMDR